MIKILQNEAITPLHTEMRFASFLSGGFTTMAKVSVHGSNKSTGKETGKTHLYAMFCHLAVFIYLS